MEVSALALSLYKEKGDCGPPPPAFDLGEFSETLIKGCELDGLSLCWLRFELLVVLYSGMELSFSLVQYSRYFPGKFVSSMVASVSPDMSSTHLSKMFSLYPSL